MAKKKKNTGEENPELVTKYDQSEKVTISDSQQFEITNCDIKNMVIKSMIRVIRGQQVMLDFDLATLYGVTTGRLNEQVKRNIERFPDDFMFQLTKGELESLRSQIVTSNLTIKENDGIWKSQNAISNFAKMGLRRPPYAFTRNGIGMLSSVLRSETAVSHYACFHLDSSDCQPEYADGSTNLQY